MPLCLFLINLSIYISIYISIYLYRLKWQFFIFFYEKLLVIYLSYLSIYLSIHLSIYAAYPGHQLEFRIRPRRPWSPGPGWTAQVQSRVRNPDKIGKCEQKQTKFAKVVLTILFWYTGSFIKPYRDPVYRCTWSR